MKSVALFIAVWLGTLSPALAQEPQLTKEAVAACERFIEIAKREGYADHKDSASKALPGLKPHVIAKALSGPPNRVENIQVIADQFYEMNKDRTGLKDLLKFTPVTFTRKLENGDLELEYSVLFPADPGNRQIGFRWLWQIRREDQAWKIVSITQERFSK